LSEPTTTSRCGTDLRQAEETTMLTGNDVALAETAVALAISWHKKQPTDFNRREIQKLEALRKKLGEVLDRAAFEDDESGDVDVLEFDAARAEFLALRGNGVVLG